MEEELKKLISENKVIPFVGAGVSKNVKYKNGENVFLNWEELLIKLNEKTLEEPTKNYIKHCIKNKKKNYLQLADMIEEELTPNEFNKKLKEIFDIDFNEVDNSTLELAKTVWELNCKLIITTNYDKVLYHSCSDVNKKFWDIESVHEQATSLRDGISHSTIWHLHGHIDNVNNTILTSQKYNELYTSNSENSRYKSALETLQTTINTKSLLFIGFSLDDEFVVNQLNRTIEIFGGNGHEHYVLCKKGSNPNTLNKNIKVIEYENYGQPLIDKIKSLAPTSTNIENKTEEITPIKAKEEFRQLTTLPNINKDFIGRKEELEEIEKRLAENSLICIVNGIGGIGKSELSYKYLHENKHKYKNIAFVEFTKDDSSIEEIFIRKFKDEFGFDNNVAFDSVIKRLQKLPERNLLLLDNLENIEDFEKIKALNTNFDLLITTRKDIDSKNQLNLDTLNPKDAKELFLNIFNQDENIEDILVYLDNHPLFITLTAKSLDKKYITLEELRENIKNNTISKIDSTNDKTFKEHLQNTFDRQFTSESKDELKELLQILAIFPSIEISFEILQKSTGFEKLRVNLQKLVERGWLTNKEDSYKLHQIIRTFIITEYKIEYEKVTFIFENIIKYINFNNFAYLFNKFSIYIPIIETILNVFKNKNDELYCELLDSLTLLYIYSYQFEKSILLQNDAINIRLNIFGNITLKVLQNYDYLYLIYHILKDLDKAHYYLLKSLNLKLEIAGEKYSELPITYSNLSILYNDLKENKKAFEFQEKALVLGLQILGEKHLDLANIYTNYSTLYENIGNHIKAFEYLEKAINLRIELFGTNHPDLISNYNNLSMIYQNLGNKKEAFNYQKKALELNLLLFGENNFSLINNYNNIAMMYQDKKDYDMALNYQRKALILSENIVNNNQTISIIYSNLAYLYKEKKECKNAKKFMNKAIEILKNEYNSESLLRTAINFIIDIDIKIKKEKNLNYKKKGKFCKDI